MGRPRHSLLSSVPMAFLPGPGPALPGPVPSPCWGRRRSCREKAEEEGVGDGGATEARPTFANARASGSGLASSIHEEAEK